MGGFHLLVYLWLPLGSVANIDRRPQAGGPGIGEWPAAEKAGMTSSFRMRLSPQCLTARLGLHIFEKKKVGQTDE